jgi:hypothetical protein
MISHQPQHLNWYHHWKLVDILGLKSQNNYSLSEGRSSFVLSTCSHDLAMGSRGGSSDGGSMKTFSELVASSQRGRRGRWSFDREHFGAGFGKISGCSRRLSYSPSLDLQNCGACSKFLTEKFVRSRQRIGWWWWCDWMMWWRNLWRGW